MSESEQPTPIDPQDDSPEVRHARQIAGLMPPFGKDRPGNHNGTKRAVSPVEVLRRLIPGTQPPPYGLDDLRRMANGNDPMMCGLARDVLCWCSPRERWAINRKGEQYPAGFDPEPGKMGERLLDRLVGKPRQTVKIESEPVRSVVDINVDIAAMLVATPSLRAVVTAALAVDPAQPAARPAALEGPAQSAESSEPTKSDGGGAPKSESRGGGGVTNSQAADLSPKCSDIVQSNDAEAGS